MLNIAAICDQYAWLYTTLPMQFYAQWDHVIPTDGAYVAIKRVDGVDYVMFRGSVTFLDWMADFANFAVPIETDALGGVHPGFYAGVMAVRDRLDALLGDRVVIVGHSLGAGHAALYAGLRAAQGKLGQQLVMFGEPKAGCARLTALLGAIPVTSYRNMDPNGHDLITEVPFSLPPLLNYQHPRALTNVSHSPAATDPWGLFRYHHFGLYARALGASGAAALSLPV